MNDFGIMVFGHTRVRELGDLLESLERQNAMRWVELWLDGYQGKDDLKDRVRKTQLVCDRYGPPRRRYHHGQLGFRKMMLQAMQSAVANYRHILFLEDDCFVVRNAVAEFRRELEAIADDPSVFSVYGHHFGMAEEGGRCSRFQGWGWATTAEKLAPYVDKLVECYSMSEQDFLDFTNAALTSEIEARLDVTPPRLPTDTLRGFFAWDETLALLTALDGRWHQPTSERLVYNCGLGGDSSHFSDQSVFRKPPFNMISPDDVWDVF